jgi:hypothetical protein
MSPNLAITAWLGVDWSSSGISMASITTASETETVDDSDELDCDDDDDDDDDDDSDPLLRKVIILWIIS